MKTIACGSPFGVGGQGLNLAQLVEDARAQGELAAYFCARIKPGDEAVGVQIASRTPRLLARYSPLRFNPGWRAHAGSESFDRAVARQLNAVQVFVGFSGQCLRSFRTARRLGVERLVLVSPTTHVENVARRHHDATMRFPIESAWLGGRQHRKMLSEYALADVILVGSEHARQTFLAEGVEASRLQRIEWRVHPRFQPAVREQQDDVFRILYVGALTVAKGLPVLREAFVRLPAKPAELTLVGGWASRRMRRYIEEWMLSDPRVRVLPGDPLPLLCRADVLVHPSYDDGFGYAPMEALACGVPVIVTEDTGMKEHVEDGVTGFVVPTGDIESLLGRLRRLVVCRNTGMRDGTTLVDHAS